MNLLLTNTRAPPVTESKLPIKINKKLFVAVFGNFDPSPLASPSTGVGV